MQLNEQREAVKNVGAVACILVLGFCFLFSVRCFLALGVWRLEHCILVMC